MELETKKLYGLNNRDMIGFSYVITLFVGVYVGYLIFKQ